jgi:hypothetical protein
VLAKSIPVVISFLASLLGLGGISEKIKAVIEKIREPINAAIDWVINLAVTAVKAVGKLLGLGGKEDAKKDPQGHHQLAQKASDELQKVTEKPKDYQSLRQNKEAQAKGLEKTYSAQLEPGVRLRIHFRDAPPEKMHQELDYDVIIAPNDEVVPGAIPLVEDEKSPVEEQRPILVVVSNRWNRGIVEKIIPGKDFKPEANVRLWIKIKLPTGLIYANATIIREDIDSTKKQYRRAGDLPAEITELLKNELLHPGPNAHEYITTNSYAVSEQNRISIQPIGNQYGCHHLGTKKPDERWIPDHQPPSSLIKYGLIEKPSEQRLYPHSSAKSNAQGKVIIDILKLYVAEEGT